MLSYPAGTVVDATFMSAAKALDAFLADEIAKTKDEGTLFSLHMKATMMKVSDPIIFGHAVKAFLKRRCFEASTATTMTELGREPQLRAWATLLDKGERRCRDHGGY